VVLHALVKSLQEEASARHITVVPSKDAHYRVRGYLAAHSAGRATSIAWALDVYDGQERRALRISGEETASGRSWAAADGQVLDMIASTSMQKLAIFAATAGTAQEDSIPTARFRPAAAAGGMLRAALGRIDDWAPEASGIFRLLGREPPREAAGDPGTARADNVPVPRSRPNPADAGAASRYALAVQGP
jgi:hypothetical protein